MVGFIPGERGTKISGQIIDNQDHKEFMLGREHRLAPECVVSLGSISFEEEIEGQWTVTLEKECPIPFTNKNTSVGTRIKPHCSQGWTS